MMAVPCPVPTPVPAALRRLVLLLRSVVLSQLILLRLLVTSAPALLLSDQALLPPELPVMPSDPAVLRRLVDVLQRLVPRLQTVPLPPEPVVLGQPVMVLLCARLSLRTVSSQQLVVPLPWVPCLRSVAPPTLPSRPPTTR